jgi:hypothetical protein
MGDAAAAIEVRRTHTRPAACANEAAVFSSFREGTHPPLHQSLLLCVSSSSFRIWVAMRAACDAAFFVGGIVSGLFGSPSLVRCLALRGE